MITAKQLGRTSVAEHRERCHPCNGRGQKALYTGNQYPQFSRCPTCNGSGYAPIRLQRYIGVRAA